MDFELDIENMLNDLSDFEVKFKKAIGEYGDVAGKKFEAQAKQNEDLLDRTGLSRRTIKGGKEWEGDKCIIYVAGEEQNFPYLELANDKKYAILKPAVDKLSSEILKGMSNLGM